MKIKSKILVDFLKKCQMDGCEKILETVLKFEESGLKIVSNSMTKNSMSLGWLKTSAFKEYGKDYEQIGNMGINELDKFISVLSRFGEFITLKKEGNLLTVGGESKKVDIELIAENFLPTTTDEPKLDKLENTFVINSKQLKEVLDDARLNKDTTVRFETVDKGVKITNTGKYKFSHNIEAPTCKAGSATVFGEPFFGAVKNFDANIEISIGTKYPAKIIEKTEHSVVTIIVGPRVDD